MFCERTPADMQREERHRALRCSLWWRAEPASLRLCPTTGSACHGTRSEGQDLAKREYAFMSTSSVRRSICSSTRKSRVRCVRPVPVCASWLRGCDLSPCVRPVPVCATWLLGWRATCGPPASAPSATAAPRSPVLVPLRLPAQSASSARRDRGSGARGKRQRSAAHRSVFALPAWYATPARRPGSAARSRGVCLVRPVCAASVPCVGRVSRSEAVECSVGHAVGHHLEHRASSATVSMLSRCVRLWRAHPDSCQLSSSGHLAAGRVVSTSDCRSRCRACRDVVAERCRRRDTFAYAVAVVVPGRVACVTRPRRPADGIDMTSVCRKDAGSPLRRSARPQGKEQRASARMTSFTGSNGRGPSMRERVTVRCELPNRALHVVTTRRSRRADARRGDVRCCHRGSSSARA